MMNTLPGGEGNGPEDIAGFLYKWLAEGVLVCDINLCEYSIEIDASRMLEALWRMRVKGSIWRRLTIIVFAECNVSFGYFQ